MALTGDRGVGDVDNSGPFTVVRGDTNDDNQATLKSEPRYPPHVFSKEAEDLIRKLLAKNPASRLGSGPTASMEIMVRTCGRVA